MNPILKDIKRNKMGKSRDVCIGKEERVENRV